MAVSTGVSYAQQVMPTAAAAPTANDPIVTWTNMVKAALNNRNKYARGTPDYQKWNQLYISRSQNLAKLQQQASVSQTSNTPAPAPKPPVPSPTTRPPAPAPAPAPTPRPPTPGNITPISQTPVSPSLIRAPSPYILPTFQPAPTPTYRPPIAPAVGPTVTSTQTPLKPVPTPVSAPAPAPAIKPAPTPGTIGPTPGSITPPAPAPAPAPVDPVAASTIGPGVADQVIPAAAKPPDDYPPPTDKTPADKTPMKPASTDPNNPQTPESVASEGQNLEYDFKNKELTLNDRFRYYQTNQQHQEFAANLDAALKQMRLDFTNQGRQLDNEQEQIIGDLENRATELQNQMALGMSDLDTQKAIAQLQSDAQERLGSKGLDVDLSKSMAQIEAQTKTGLTGLYLQQEQAAGQLGLDKQLGLTQMGMNLAGQLAGNRSNERLAGINAAGQMAPQMRSIASNERLGFAGMGSDLANQSQALNSQRQTQLMQMGLTAEQAIRQTETERQLGLTQQTMQGYQTLAQMNQQPENWLSAFSAMRGMDVPASARTGQANSLGQYLQQLSSLGLNINPGQLASSDAHAGQAFRTGRDIDPNMLNGDVGTLVNNYNNAAFQGLGQERTDAQHQTGRMYDIAESGRAQDANMLGGLVNKTMNEGLENNNVLGQAGYDPKAAYKRIDNQLDQANYYDPSMTTQYQAGGPMDEMTYQDWKNQQPLQNANKFASVPGPGNYFAQYNPQQDWQQYMGPTMGAASSGFAPSAGYVSDDSQNYSLTGVQDDPNLKPWNPNDPQNAPQTLPPLPQYQSGTTDSIGAPQLGPSFAELGSGSY